MQISRLQLPCTQNVTPYSESPSKNYRLYEKEYSTMKIVGKVTFRTSANRNIEENFRRIAARVNIN